MGTTTVLLTVLTLLIQGAIGYKSNVIRETVQVSTFTASKTNDGSIIFPTNVTLPPILRSLTIKPSGSRFTADGPFIDVGGEAFFKQKNTVLLIFGTPRVQVNLSVLRSTSTALTLRGKAMHSFERPFGMRLHRSKLSVPDGVEAATTFLDDAKSPAQLLTVINHTFAADSVGLGLPESSVVIFTSPELESKVWPSQPAVGLDLPLEIVMIASPLDVTYVGWNAYSLVRKRFGISGAAEEEALSAIDALNAQVASVASDRKLKASSLTFDIGRIEGELDGVVVGEEKGDGVAAYDRVVTALDTDPIQRIPLQVLHDEVAQEVGTETDGLVSRMVIFGDPAFVARVMQRSFTAALDLPSRMSVWSIAEKSGSFAVGYTSAEWIGRRHSAQVPEPLGDALETFSAVGLEGDA